MYKNVEKFKEKKPRNKLEQKYSRAKARIKISSENYIGGWVLKSPSCSSTNVKRMFNMM